MWEIKPANWDPSESQIEDGNAEIGDKLLKVFKEKNCQVIEKVREIGIPLPGEQLRLITMKSFNASAFIEMIAGEEQINHAILVIFAINMEAARLFIKLVKEGRIKTLELVVSCVRNAGYSIKSKAVELLSTYPEIKMVFINSHAKISTMSTAKGNYYTIEGSGNFSYNQRIEQYIIDNDKNIYDFTCSWVKEMKETMKDMKDFIVIN